MKYEHALLLATAGLAVAGPHHHAHRHAHNHVEQRAPAPAEDIVYVKETKLVYLLDGKEVSESEVKAGFANGTLIMGDGGKPERVDPVTSVVTASKPSSTPVPTTTSLAAAPVVLAEVKATTSAAPKAISIESTSSSSGGSGLDRPFENGKLSCDTFPSAFGAMALPGLKLGGWSGIQTPVDMGSCYTDIVTTNFFSDGNCSEGAYCSYACPVGYQKASWPKKQGCTKQSVGGLKCKGGLLYMADDSVGKTLCVPGDENVKIKMKNTSSKGVAFCRTDYPGTESMVIPAFAGPGDTKAICSNNQATYYHWGGDMTSSQWYAQKHGVSAEDGCQWSSLDKEAGNFSPTSFGAGYVPADGINYISLATNKPSTQATLDYNIEFVSEPANLMNGACGHWYDPATKVGKYCSKKNSNGKWDPSSCNDKGCTAAAKKGATVYVVISDP